MPDYDLHINPQMRKSAIQLLPPALSCDVEFGAGFLPPETGAPKGPEDDVSEQRPEIGDHDRSCW
jgi:hypothetical protein